MGTQLKYNPETKQMEKVETSGSSSSTWNKGDIDYIIGGDMLRALEECAREDGVDLSDKKLRAQCVKGYVTAAINEWQERRKALKAEAEAKAKQEAEAKAKQANANNANANAPQHEQPARKAS